MKLLNLRKFFLAVAFVLGLAMMASPSADAKELTLVNNTGRDIIVLNCSPTISTQWYEDVLGDDIWPNGTTVTLDFDRWCFSDTWDFLVHYENGQYEDWDRVNVRTVNTIILRPDGTNEYL